MQQLLLPHSAPYIAQSSAYPFFVLPQVLPPSGIPLPSAPSHRYTDPRAMAPGGTIVDPEDPLGVAYSAYVAPTLPAQSSTIAPLDTLLARVGDLERAQRSSQGGDRWPYQFQDLCYFPEAVLPANLHVLEFEKYNGKGCQSHIFRCTAETLLSFRLTTGS